MGRRGIEDISEQEIVRLYCDDQLSTTEVARRLGWSESAIRSRLVQLGISRRTAWAYHSVDVAADDLRRLYVDEGLSLSIIAERYGCSLTTIWRKLTALGVACREGGPGPRYERADFSGDPAEKAYLVGFRQGDLHVALDGHTIAIKCTSTRTEQVELFRRLFEPYGHVYTDEATLTDRRRQSIGMGARLNTTFDFLLPKQDLLPKWVTDSEVTFFAYLAGYLDAEGYFRTYVRPGNSRIEACMEVRSYDAVLLTELGDELNARGVICPSARLRVAAGYTNGYGVRSNGDLWGLGVHRVESLRCLIAKLDPYIKHGRRRRDMLRVLSVINNR